jgi:hypothetical protein
MSSSTRSTVRSSLASLLAWDGVYDALRAAERGESVVIHPVPLGSTPIAQIIKRWTPKMKDAPIVELEKVLEALGADPQREQATRRKSRSS